MKKPMMEMPMMPKMKMKVQSDHVAKFKKSHEEMGMSEDMMEVIPSDLYGNRITLNKGNNLQDIIEDRIQVHGLD